MLECRQINYNYRLVGPLQADQGYEFDTYVVGTSGVVKITNSTPIESYFGPEYFDVTYEDGRVTTVYNVNQAFYFPI